MRNGEKNETDESIKNNFVAEERKKESVMDRI